MNGELIIKVKGSEIHVQGYLKEASMIDQMSIVDALMNTFDMKGVIREIVCDTLLDVDKSRSKSTDDTADLLEKLFSKLKEES